MKIVGAFLKTIRDHFIDFTILVSKLAFHQSTYQRFKDWAEMKNYKILKIESSSAWEGKNFFTPVSQPAVYAKVILTDAEKNEKGAYLMVGSGDSIYLTQVKYVLPEKIRFKEPMKFNEDNSVSPFV